MAGFPPAWLNWAVDPKTRQRVLDLPSNILGLRMIRRRKLDGRFMLSSHARGRVTTAEREACRVRTSRIRLKNGARDVTVRPSSSRDGDGVGWVLLLILGDVPFGKIVGWRIVTMLQGSSGGHSKPTLACIQAMRNRLDRFDLLILDDLAYVTKDQAETSVLFELISARYERRSILITANQPFGEWGKVFPDPAIQSPRSTGSCTTP